MYDWSGLGPIGDFIGLQNFRRVFEDHEFRQAALHNVWIFLALVVITNTVSLCPRDACSTASRGFVAPTGRSSSCPTSCRRSSQASSSRSSSAPTSVSSTPGWRRSGSARSSTHGSPIRALALPVIIVAPRLAVERARDGDLHGGAAERPARDARGRGHRRGEHAARVPPRHAPVPRSGVHRRQRPPRHLRLPRLRPRLRDRRSRSAPRTARRS